jgi:hypothetical protein
VNAGESFTLSSRATGTATLKYKWYHNGVAISGATSRNLVISGATESDAGDYFVTVTNSAGSDTSAVATVTIISPPGIVAQPRDQSAALGSAVALTLEANGSAPLEYQWYHDGTAIVSGTAATLNISAVQEADAGAYFAVVSNSAGSATSSVATVSLTLTAPSVVAQPVNRVVNAGSDATLSIVASGSAPLIYQWYHDGSLILGANSSTYAIGAAQASDAGNYYAVVTNSAGSATSVTVSVTVNLPPVITSSPSSQTAPAGTELSLVVKASGSGPISYQWYHDNQPILSATGGNLVISSLRTNDAGTYYAIATNPAGSATSASATVNVVTGSKQARVSGTNNGKSGKNGASINAYLSVPAGQLVLSVVESTGVVLQVVGDPGRIYDLEVCADMKDPQWETIASVVAAEDGFVELTTQDLTDYAYHFYRAVPR